MATEIPATGRESILFAIASTRSLSSVGGAWACAIAQHASRMMVTAARFIIDFCMLCSRPHDAERLHRIEDYSNFRTKTQSGSEISTVLHSFLSLTKLCQLCENSVHKLAIFW